MSIVEYTGPSNPQEIRQYLMRRTKDEIVHEYLRQWRYSGEVEKERDAAADYARDQAAVLDLVAKALGVPDEPHQGRAERILEAAEGLALKVADLERAIKFQASAARRGMDAAKAHGGHMETEARRLYAESNPEALESERRANAQLTEENAALAAQLQEQLNDCINFDGGKLTDGVMERSSRLLKGEAEQVERDDAERYRFLKAIVQTGTMGTESGCLCAEDTDQWDEIIDKHRRQAEGGE